MARRTSYTSSRGRCQAQAARSRGRRVGRQAETVALDPNQLDIFDALADISDQDQDHAEDQETTR